MTQDSQAPTVYSLYKIQVEHDKHISLINERMSIQQKSLEDINKGIRTLVWLVFAGFAGAFITFVINGGLRAH